MEKEKYPTVYSTADIAGIKWIGKELFVLVGKKLGHNKYQFPGGFCDPEDTGYENTAIREMKEETGVSSFILDRIGCFTIEDPRYKDTPHCIWTHFFLMDLNKYNKDYPTAGDDLAALQWIALSSLKSKWAREEHIRTHHIKLVEELIKYLNRKGYDI